MNLPVSPNPLPPDATRSAAAMPAPGERLRALDTLRALALFGVIAMNVVAMEMALVADVVMAAAGPHDRLAALFDLVFLQGKARSAFAFLFGLGFGVLLARAQARGAGTGFFLRRMGALLVLGIVNALFLFWGDILIAYALLGALLTGFAGAGDRTLARVGLGLVIGVPLLQGLVAAFVGPWPVPSIDHGASVRAAVAAFASPVFDAGVIAANAERQLMLWIDDPMQRVVYLSSVFGLFLLGLLTARRGWLFAPGAHRPFLTRVAWIGLGIGTPLSVVYATIRLGVPLDEPYAGLRLATYVGLPVMAFGYLALFALWFDRGAAALQRFLAPVGRMTLTGYLASNALGTLVFHGYGLGRMGEINLLACNAIAVAIFLALVAFAHPWFRRFRFGPAETIWRKLASAGS